jgi:hypothetical protein
VPFEPGKKRGKVFVPKYTEAEMEVIKHNEAIAEAVRLDDDEEAALGTATVDDLVKAFVSSVILRRNLKEKNGRKGRNMHIHLTYFLTILPCERKNDGCLTLAFAVLRNVEI